MIQVASNLGAIAEDFMLQFSRFGLVGFFPEPLGGPSGKIEIGRLLQYRRAARERIDSQGIPGDDDLVVAVRLLTPLTCAEQSSTSRRRCGQCGSNVLRTDAAQSVSDGHLYA